MKHLLYFTFVLIFSFSGKSQTQANETHFFGQCLVNSLTNQEMIDLEINLRQNPFVQVARVDALSKRVFILTKDVTSFSAQDFQSWLGDFSSASTCSQIGLYGVDQINPFPFTNCQN